MVLREQGTKQRDGQADAQAGPRSGDDFGADVAGAFKRVPRPPFARLERFNAARLKLFHGCGKGGGLGRVFGFSSNAIQAPSTSTPSRPETRFAMRTAASKSEQSATRSARA